MVDNREKNRRRSIRMKSYDYSAGGPYYVTICTKHRECLFGNILKENMKLSRLGRIARKNLLNIPKHFENIELDTYVVMPNHIHVIIMIHGEDPYPESIHRKDNQHRGVMYKATTKKYYSQISPGRNSLPVIIRTYKASVTRWCKNNNSEYFKWQRNYYERIIRNETECNKIRQYILDNPSSWELDRSNPMSENFVEGRYI